MADIINPGRGRQTNPLEMIAAGLNIAKSITGMQADSEDRELKKQALADQQAGIVGQADVREIEGKGYREAPEDYQGPGIRLPGIRTAEGVSGPKTYFKAPEKEKPQLFQTEQGVVAVTPTEARQIPGSEIAAKKEPPKKT